MTYPIWYTPEQIDADRALKSAREKSARMVQFRKRRNAKLAECDWTQMPDAPLTAEQKAAWAEYRQALRDVPATVTADGWVTWPTRPG